MGLPHELLQYAENIFRRFPDVFTALGAPGLEDVYDLWPNGTMSHCIEETPCGKSVVVKLQRRQWPCPSTSGWQHPAAPGAFHYPQYHMPHPAAQWDAGAYGGQLQQPAAAPVQIAPHNNTGAYSEQPPVAITASLARVEAALSVLAPQVEALRARTTKTAAAVHGHTALAMQLPQPTTPGAGSSGEPVVVASAAGTKVRLAEIAAPAVRNLPTTAVTVQEPAPASTKNADGKASSLARKPANIKPVRMSPAYDDPVSPRSPGRYSVWK